jgi:hypothetical protein
MDSLGVLRGGMNNTDAFNSYKKAVIAGKRSSCSFSSFFPSTKFRLIMEALFS